MKITAIKKQVKNPDRVSVFVDEKYSFSLSLDEVIVEKIYKGLVVEQPDVKRLKKLSADGKFRLKAMKWVLNRPHSVHEFQDYMRKNKIEPEHVNQLQGEFLSKGYLNDINYARWLIDLRQRAGKSNRMIRAELFKKGLSSELIDQSFESTTYSDEQKIKKLISKKSKLARYRSDPQKLASYLLRQGFDYQLVKQALKINSSEN